MKKLFIILIVLLAVFIAVFAGCLRKTPKPLPSESEPAASASESQPPESSAPEIRNKAETPDGAAELLFESISNLDQDKINEIVGQYFSGKTLPEEYFCLLEPISERISYKIGDFSITGDTAEVDVSITSIDAQNAINSVMAGAVMHLAAMQLTGKDVSNPEKILAEYVADNVNWDEIPTVKSDTTLYLVKGADGEWKIDAANPENLGFADAVSGGAVEVAKNLKAFADKYK